MYLFAFLINAVLMQHTVMTASEDTPRIVFLNIHNRVPDYAVS